MVDLFLMISPNIIDKGQEYGIIYIIRDIRNDKIYVGQTTRSLIERFSEHLRNPPNKYFRNAVKFYADQNIELNVIKVNEHLIITENNEFIMEYVIGASSQLELNKLESQEISNRKSCVLDYYIIKEGSIIPTYGYNIQRGGTNTTLRLASKDFSTYNHISEMQLKNLIKKGLFVSEIAQEFRVPALIILAKLQEFWSYLNIYSIEQARNYFGGSEIYNSRIKHIRPVYDSFQYSKEQLERLEDLIRSGYATSQIKLNMNIDSGDLYRMLNTLGFSSFTRARDKYGCTEIFNQRARWNLIESVRRGIKHDKYIDIDERIFFNLVKDSKNYKEIANSLKIGKRTVYKKSIEILGLSLPDAYRLFNLYPKIEDTLLKAPDSEKRIKDRFLDDFLSSGLTVEEIDKEILKILISLSYSKKEMETLFSWDHFRMTRWITYILGHDMYRAREEYWWKPRIIHLLSLGYSLRQIRNMSKKIIGKHVTYDIIKRVFASEFKLYRSKLGQYLKLSYGP